MDPPSKIKFLSEYVVTFNNFESSEPNLLSSSHGLYKPSTSPPHALKPKSTDLILFSLFLKKIRVLSLDQASS